MPFALALLASALIHVAALVGPGWELPGTHEPEPSPPLAAVLAKPAAKPDPVPAAKPPARPRPERPRPPATGGATPAMPALASAPTLATEAPEAPPPEPPAAVSGTRSEPAPSLPVAAPVAVRIALPGKGRVRYAITRGEGGFVVGQAVHEWEHDGLAYTLSSVTETTGLAALFKPARVVQGSRGEVTADGLRPREFRHERVGGLDTAAFDWARRTVAYAGREEAVAAGAQDMLSMYYQLVLQAPKSGAVELAIATGRKLENYRFEVLGEESLELPSGERRALRVKTRSGADSIELWLAVGRDAEARGLPLKIRFTDRKGEIFDQLAQDIDIRESQ